MTKRARHAVLVGAGIAGPALALFLRRIGYRVTLCETRPPDHGWLGSYFSLADNGRSVLRALTLLDEVEAVGTPTTSIVFQDHRGTELARNDEPTILIRRDRLGEVLRNAARRHGARIAYGKRLVDLDATAGGVSARFHDGTEVRGDLLVGCDGVHSRVRRLLFPDNPPASFTRMIDGGGLSGPVPGVEPDGILRLTFGARAFFGYQGLPSGEVVWFQSLSAPESETRDDGDPGRARAGPRAVDAGQWQARLLDLHQQDHHPIRDIIEATDGPIVRWPVYELPQVPRWSRGPVCLAGDAVHAMQPHDGQSASMALEDALVLAQCLRDLVTPEEAFEAFEQRRIQRVEWVAARARHTGSLKFPTTARERRVRDAVLSLYLAKGIESSAQVSQHRLDWDQATDGALRPNSVS